MGLSAIRHIATSYRGTRLVAGAFERLVSVWDLDNGQMVSKFETCFDTGGTRLAISEDGNTVAAGSYKLNLIGLHRSQDGSIIWEKKGFKEIQHVRFEPWKGRLLICLNDFSCYILDTKKGLITGRYRGERVIPSPYHRGIVALEEKKIICIRNVIDKVPAQEQSLTIKKETFGVLSMAFSLHSVYISEAGGPVRSFNLEDGSLRWRYDPKEGYHFLRLGYSEGCKRLFGILWGYKKGGKKEIYSFDAMTGEIIGRKKITGRASETEFALRGNILITSDGDVYDVCATRGPVIQMRLDFPRGDKVSYKKIGPDRLKE